MTQILQSATMGVLEYLERLPRKFLIPLGILLILLIGTLDYVTGGEISFSVFYLIPIAIVTWRYNDLRVSVGMAFFGAVMWFIVNRLSGLTYSSDLIPFWNAGVRLSFFLIVVFLLHSVRSRDEYREELQQFIVHDLRSPLSNAISGLTLLIDISEDTLDEQQLELVNLSASSCQQMLTLVNSLLDMAKLESGHFEVDLAPTSTQELFADTMKYVSAIAIQKSVHLSQEIDANTQQIAVDRELMLRVLINLVSNALKYSPMDSTIYFRARSHNQGVELQIQDEGAGIPKEWAEKVFSKFAQVEAKHSGKKIGSGLGLTFCRLAVEAQGGRIWITSDVGQGTTVSVTIPKA